MHVTEVHHTDGCAQWMDVHSQITNESSLGKLVMHECMHDQNCKRASFMIMHGDLPT